jgi:hypothetical protein
MFQRFLTRQHSVLEQARDAADRQKAQRQSRRKDVSSSDLLAKSLQYSNIVLPTKASKKIVSIMKK